MTTLAEKLKELAYSTAMDPVLIRFLDGGKELMVVPRPHLSDVSWVHRGSYYQEIISQSAFLDAWAENDDPATIGGDAAFEQIAKVMMS